MNNYQNLINEKWSYAETGFEEYKSATIMADFLESEDFKVNRGIANMPTAYDVDKVVEQLENERKFWENAYDSNLGKEKARSYEHAIEIMKGGVVDG